MTKINEAARVTSRLTELAELLAQGHSNVAIAKRFGVNESSVRRARARHGLRGPKPEGAAAIQSRSPEWGFGQAQLVEPATKEDWEVGVVFSDLHFPYQDDAVLDAGLALVEDLKPHRVILNGDVNDFFQLSRFNTGHQRLDDLQLEINLANEYRARVRESAPDAVINETEGNHDNRIRSYVEHNGRALASLEALSPASLFMYDDLEINWHPGCGFLLRKDFLVKHGTKISSVPGGTARAELMENLISGISGHVHRSESAAKHGYHNPVWNVSGCMCRLDPDYIVGKPNWNQSVLVYEISKSGLVHVTNVPFIGGVLRFGGRAYA